MARAGFGVILPHGWTKTLIFIVVAPILGMVLALIFMTMMFWIFRRSAPQQVDGWFRRLQLLSAASYSLGHGGNDAQKTMGIIAGALYSAKIMTKHEFSTTWGHFHWPIILGANLAMGLGTYFGGWRIVHTMGSKITKLKPIGGFCAETAGAITLFATAAAVVAGDTTPYPKPHPAPLLEAARLLGFEPQHCVYVGDDERDVQAGSANVDGVSTTAQP